MLIEQLSKWYCAGISRTGQLIDGVRGTLQDIMCGRSAFHGRGGLVQATGNIVRAFQM